MWLNLYEVARAPRASGIKYSQKDFRALAFKALGLALLLSLQACGGGNSGSKDTPPASSVAASVAASSVAASSVAPSSVAASSVAPSSVAASSVAPSSTPASSAAASSSSSLPFTLASTNLTNGTTIPNKYTCDGTNVNPQLHWDNVPTGTKSFAIIMDDPDALSCCGVVWVHWNLYNIPGTVSEIAEAASPSASLLPAGAQEASTSFGSAKYGGPCPPSGRHKYYFGIYALNKDTITYTAPSTRADFETAHAADIISKSYLTGYFR